MTLRDTLSDSKEMLWLKEEIEKNKTYFVLNQKKKNGYASN